MTVTGAIAKGTTNWDVPLNADLLDLQAQATGLQAQVTANLDSLSFSVDNHGAVGDGVTPDQVAIQALLSAAPKGGTVRLGRKRYALSGKLTIPPYVTLAGPGVDRDAVSADAYPALVPLAGYPDGTVIELVDQATGGYATANRDVHIFGVNIDGVNLTTETVSAVRATGFVHGVVMRDVGIANMTSHSVALVSGASGNPYSWNLDNVQINGSSAAATTWDGLHFIGTDHVLVNTRTEGVRGNGFFLSGCSNTQVSNCRAEWSAVNGFYVTGSYGTAQGSGGIILSGCSTDRNNQYGVLIDSTGNSPVVVNGLQARRDGRNGFPGAGGGSFAALRGTSATMPIIVEGMSCYPGVGDDGLGVSSPERGTSFGGCTWVSVSNSYLHSDVTPFHDAGTNTALLRGPGVGTATGTTGSPVRGVVEPANGRGTFTVANSTDIAAFAATNTVANTSAHYTATSFTAGSEFLRSQVTGESVGRYDVLANGSMSWGGGAATRDVTLARGAANRLDVSTADLRVNTAGRGIQVAEGSNAKSGLIALVAGTVTVANTATTANSRIQLTSQADGGTPGWLRVSARTAATSFTITSSSATDTSSVAWLIIEP